MILTQAEVERLVHARHHNPHELLGMHSLGDGAGVVVRAMHPGAAEIQAVPVHEPDQPTVKLEKVDASGLFEAVAPAASHVYAYDLVVTDAEGKVVRGLKSGSHLNN
jgi:hypothetical protein